MSRPRPTSKSPTVVIVLTVALLVALAFYLDKRNARGTGNFVANQVVVTQTKTGRTMFDVYAKSGILWSRRGSRVTITTLLDMSRRDGTPLWQIEASTPHYGPVEYGVVPKGFSQMISGHGLAPSLEEGKTYDVSAFGGAGIGRGSFRARKP